MAEFTVTASELKSKANELSSLNNKFQQEITTLVTEENALKAMWEGEAKEAFSTAFNRDKAKMDNFHKAIQDYIQKLNMIAAQYEQAERTNVATARS